MLLRAARLLISGRESRRPLKNCNSSPVTAVENCRSCTDPERAPRTVNGSISPRRGAAPQGGTERVA